MVNAFELDNGMRVVIKEMHHAPIASFWIWYRVGSRNERSGITGISHWVEHMLFKGTDQFPPGELDRQISRTGGMLNGMTWLDFTTFLETLPSDQIELALRIEADRMLNAQFTEEDVESERTVIISERQGAENRPMFLLGEEVQAAAFRVHPYHHETIGNMCDLETITRADLWDHYRTYYGPHNAVAVLVGDVDTDQALAQIDSLFGPNPRGPQPTPVAQVEPEQKGERRVVVEGDGSTAYLDIAFRAPEATDDRFPRLRVLNAVLAGANSMSLFGSGSGDNKSSRLYKALVETGLATSVSSSVTPAADPFLYGISATVRSGRTAEEVEAALDVELRRLQDERVQPSELTKAIKQVRAQFAYSTESVTNQAYWLGLSEIVADHTWLESLQGDLAAVTAQEIQDLAGTLLSSRGRTSGIYAPTGVTEDEGEDR